MNKKSGARMIRRSRDIPADFGGKTGFKAHADADKIGEIAVE
jgi:hypothetical protein